MRDYEQACIEAATAQRLDGITQYLKKQGFKVEVEQTGGFTMVATVYGETHYVGITNEGDDAFLVCLTPNDADDGDDYKCLTGTDTDEYGTTPDMSRVADLVNVALGLNN